jgi:hypothetical protein
MNPESAPLTTMAGKRNPDVVVTLADQTTVFKMQNRQVSEWLRKHFNSTTGTAKGDTEIYVHPSRCKRIIGELKAAGFVVTAEKQIKLC